MMIKIAILQASFVPHAVTLLKELIKQQVSDILIINIGKNYSFIPTDLPDNVEIVKKNNLDKRAIYKLVAEFKPDLLFTAGTLDDDFNKVCHKVRKQLRVPVVAGSDAQFIGWKRWFKVILAPFRHKRYFDYMFVAGIWQYEYARMMGFAKDRILLHNLTADVELFSMVNIEEKKEKYPKSFLYIGRLSPEKGLDKLVNAWNSIENKRGWTLTLVGNGKMEESLKRQKDIIIRPFCNQGELVTYLQNSGCFILPSTYEPWALVIHEAAAAGMPMIISDVCGAIPHFLINGYNGYTFNHNKSDDLRLKLEKIINMADDQILELGANSRKLSTKITPEVSAKTLISIVK